MRTYYSVALIKAIFELKSKVIVPLVLYEWYWYGNTSTKQILSEIRYPVNALFACINFDLYQLKQKKYSIASI